MRRIMQALVMGLVMGACASATQQGYQSGGIAGSTDNLQPTIAGAAQGGSAADGPVVTVSYVAPSHAYPTFLRVYTQASVSVLAAPAPATQTALEAVDQGTHKVVLRDVPLFLRSNVRRNSPYQGHEYLLLVLTNRPLDFAALQAGFEDMDLRGPDDDVLTRVAHAVGEQSGGAWGASALRTSFTRAPF